MKTPDERRREAEQRSDERHDGLGASLIGLLALLLLLILRVCS